MSDKEKVEQGLQCMACRFDINGEATGFPQVCSDCEEEGAYDLL